MHLPTSLENELLLLRPLSLIDYEALWEAASDPFIWEQHPCNRHEKDEFDAFFDESFHSKGALVVFDKSDLRLIGSSRFKTFPEFPSVVEIGWTFLSRPYWGGWYNRSLKMLMLEYAFGLFDTVVFFVDAGNKRSQRAVEKIGANQVHSFQNNALPRPKANTLLFEIRKTQWLRAIENE